MQYYIKPLERLKDDSIVNKVHDYLHVDDTDIFNDDPYEKDEGFDFGGESDQEEEDTDNYASLPPTADTIRLFSPNMEEHDDYISTVRKTRPLPKIPDRSSSKEISKDMTLILTESLKNQNRVSAQQLFQLLSQHQSQEQQQKPQDEDDGGVYALKTQVSTLRLSNKDIVNDYYQFESPSKKQVMTPVEEVDEEDAEYAPSLTGSSASSRKSFDVTNLSDQNTLNDDFTSPYHTLKLNRDSTDSSFSTSSEDSLFADVQRLQQQNNNSMVSLPDSTTAANSEFSITSSGITHDKEAIKTFRRMATKTNDRHIQFNYAKHLMKLVSMYTGDNIAQLEEDDRKDALATRTRLQEEAEYWIEKLAKSNYAPALYIKGTWHRQCGDRKYKDIFVSYKRVDHDKAFKCFQQAAKYGSVEAYYELAEYWMVRKDYKKSVSFYKYAASKNHIPSLYKLANIMLRGLLQQKKNVAQGLVYLRQAADSKKAECALSAYDYACIISGDLESLDLESDPMIVDVCNKNNFRTAVHYFRIADEFGFVNAGFRLGEIYKTGERGTHIDLWKSYHFFAKAADHGHEGAMIEVSKLYRSGIPGCLKAQPSLAFQWCLRAANNGNEVAEYLVGTYCEDGVGVYPDYNQALDWYRKSATKEYGPAQEKVNPGQQRHSAPRKEANKRYYQQSIRMNEEKSRAEQNCRVM